jgi:hypothetical protein
VREFLEQARAKKVRSRILVSKQNNTIYVLGYFGAREEPKSRESELGLRCLVAKAKIGQCDTIVGIGLCEHDPQKGSASILIYMHLPDWSETDQEGAIKIGKEFGFFKSPVAHNLHYEEYPDEHHT